jgi:hypothetical protein
MRAQVRGTLLTINRLPFCKVVRILDPSTWYCWNTNMVSKAAIIRAIATTKTKLNTLFLDPNIFCTITLKYSWFSNNHKNNSRSKAKKSRYSGLNTIKKVMIFLL